MDTDTRKSTRRQNAMFSTIAERYDLVNDLASMGQDRLWRRAAVRALETTRGGSLAGLHILDVACGTGASSRALANRGADVIGCDIADGMLAVACRRETDGSRVNRHGIRRGEVRYVAADAMRLPFADGEFDAVTVSYGLRNMPYPEVALAQMRRVCRPGGRIVVLDFDMPDDLLWRAVYTRYSTVMLPLLGGLIGGGADAYRYLNASIAQWPGRHGVMAMLRETGWHDVAARPLSGGIASLCRAVA
ncbi:ubiquinone/menaquinone biosynthesis methyltransferase [Bifidobacterium sp. SMB2]|uniref:Demethylmenaquinone methyltransferase n=1 Tax=Bifidobacterium saimiriisciurei TaxID=2661627 RepID=A0ABX0CBW8_9BIFI|nr:MULTISPECIES: ubiquinone/menaquinone biosynthesis methyltransferase [Bifidobacterium]NEG95856.1 ubiquinone/menaquinone biosynthesis methyltransferase [Bifidobacterium sp. SMB2]NEH12075.1 ubiquinone/menaquinone biosynthesis methyltransferase [Bifidobacterium saimiriisciurei]